MAIQIDAAINPGHNGGPAIMGNEVAGEAFENLSVYEWRHLFCSISSLLEEHELIDDEVE
ncbi:hypothetical protein SADUNF_Sadunf10G0134400 [Salix dunnii]|uniref:Uncharacterized protein n=1 Tax=Salix dunnii TaxID=1413687 RepID=A0A835JNI5_9ROSI|nr:hypothetical protein SADUNF_Sadunf10G0134400 [Salix dunnii]